MDRPKSKSPMMILQIVCFETFKISINIEHKNKKKIIAPEPEILNKHLMCLFCFLDNICIINGRKQLVIDVKY